MKFQNSYWPPSKIFKKRLKIAPQGARGWGSELFFLPEFLVILVRSQCKNLNSYDNPFWDFRNGGNRLHRLWRLAGRTHFARTNIMHTWELVMWTQPRFSITRCFYLYRSTTITNVCQYHCMKFPLFDSTTVWKFHCIAVSLYDILTLWQKHWTSWDWVLSSSGQAWAKHALPSKKLWSSSIQKDIDVIFHITKKLRWSFILPKI